MGASNSKLETRKLETFSVFWQVVNTHSCRLLLQSADAHLVERSPHEHERNKEEDEREHVTNDWSIFAKLAAWIGNRNRQFNREQSKQRREFDDRIQRH